MWDFSLITLFSSYESRYLIQHFFKENIAGNGIKTNLIQKSNTKKYVRKVVFFLIRKMRIFFELLKTTPNFSACLMRSSGNTYRTSPTFSKSRNFVLSWKLTDKNFVSISHCLKITQNVAFEFWYFPPIFVLLKLTCLVTLFNIKLQSFKNSPNWLFLAFLINFCPLKM